MLIFRQKSFQFCTPPLENSTTRITIPLDVPDGDDYLAIYETIDRKTNGNVAATKNKSHSMEDLETPTPSLKSFDISEENQNGHRR